MRLIDPIGLKQALVVSAILEDKKTIEQIIDEQPTIEERKKGEWIVYKAPDQYHCGMVKCPFCGEDMIAESDEYNYCPNCGSYNGGRDNDGE